MAFISRKELEGRAIGQWVALKQDVDVLSGRFERGTRMRIIADTERGLDLEDEHGNRLGETGLLGDFFTPAENPRYDFGDKN